MHAFCDSYSRSSTLSIESMSSRVLAITPANSVEILDEAWKAMQSILVKAHISHCCHLALDEVGEMNITVLVVALNLTELTVQLADVELALDQRVAHLAAALFL